MAFSFGMTLIILTRLPARSIQRFKFVSKLWGEPISRSSSDVKRL
ncbi:hypothetical protein CASFOL_041214 [Castilleja foliolosa]|uniref:Uncharacterized protein n=1 Tax=Castilleja foliolosa TaxID=1961234 RepID=A0ABD3BDT7_9LAMI